MSSSGASNLSYIFRGLDNYPAAIFSGVIVNDFDHAFHPFPAPCQNNSDNSDRSCLPPTIAQHVLIFLEIPVEPIDLFSTAGSKKAATFW